jgi:hypothetical protein
VDTGVVSFVARVEDVVGAVDERVLSLQVELYYIPGDVNGDLDGHNVADLTYLVYYLFRGGPAPPVMEAADMDGVSGVNVADLTYLVDYLFRGGPPPARR